MRHGPEDERGEQREDRDAVGRQAEQPPCGSRIRVRVAGVRRQATGAAGRRGTTTPDRTRSAAVVAGPFPVRRARPDTPPRDTLGSVLNHA